MSMKRTTWYLASALSASFLVWAAAWTWAEHLYTEGSYRLATSVYAGTDNDLWKQDLSMLESAVTLNPLHAEYFYQQASVVQQLGWLWHARSEEAAVFYAEAQRLNQQALTLRPYWSKAWLDLARMQSQQNEAIDKILQSLEKARTFGPYEPLVRRSELEIAIPLWDRLDEKQHQQLISSLRYLLRQDYRFVVNMAFSAGWAGLVKPLLVEDQHLAYFNRKLTAIKKAAE